MKNVLPTETPKIQKEINKQKKKVLHQKKRKKMIKIVNI